MKVQKLPRKTFGKTITLEDVDLIHEHVRLAKGNLLIAKRALDPDASYALTSEELGAVIHMLEEAAKRMEHIDRRVRLVWGEAEPAERAS